MEKIFKEYITPIEDNGFSVDVMQHISTIGKPSRNMYRMPTVIATVSMILVVVTISLTVGVDVLSDRYESLSQKMSILRGDRVDDYDDQSVYESTEIDYEFIDPIQETE